MLNEPVLSEVDLHLTNRCNSRCATCCYASNELVLPELASDDILGVVDQAMMLGCSEFHLSGGEPLLRADIFDLVDCMVRRHLQVRLQTNGKLLTKSTAERLHSLGLRDIMVSLDGATADICDEIRGTDAYANALTGIRNAVAHGLRVRVNAVLTTRNRDSFVAIAELARSLGATTCSSFYFTPIGRGARNADLWISPQDYLVTCEQIRDEVQQRHLCADGMNVIVEKGYARWDEATAISIAGFSGCGGGCLHVMEKRDYLIVRCDGSVFPCILLIEGPALGNIKTESLANIWKFSSQWKMLGGRGTFQECEGCPHLSLCNGGCAGYASLMSGVRDRPDPRCVRGELVPLCPVMKYNVRNAKLGGSSGDVVNE